MNTMSTFAFYQTRFDEALANYARDPDGESDPAKASQRWTVLQKFEINYNHHTKLHLDAVT
jgi:gamma-tubulin complex component 2